MPEKLQTIVSEHFDPKTAGAVWETACRRFDALAPLAEHESKSRKKNLLTSLFPFVALYQALQELGYSKEDAMPHLEQIMEVFTRTGNRKNYETMGKLPFFFPLFKTMFSMGLKGDSWEVEWGPRDKEQFVYTIKKCLWHEKCQELGCPELCHIFCHNDEINFIDVSPRLYFRRAHALGYDGQGCDFHFYRHNPDQK